MARFFREPDRRQRYLLPVDMMDWLPEGDIVHLIVDAVALMDLSGFEATCKVGKAGQAPFSPRVLLALLICPLSLLVLRSGLVQAASREGRRWRRRRASLRPRTLVRSWRIVG